MNHNLFILGSLIVAVATAGAQVASHTPAAYTPANTQTPAATQVAAGKPVARVNGTVLTERDLVREEYAIFPYARQHNGIPKELAPQIRDGALKMIVFEELVYQEALRRKMTVPATTVARAETDFRKQFPTPDDFNAFLQGEFQGSQELLREKIRRSLLIDALLKSEIESKSTVTLAEAKDFYDKNPARFEHPELFTFQTISILPPASANGEQLLEARLRSERALRQAKLTKTSEEFGLLAEKISDDDYRVVMGQHKPVAADQLPPQVVKTLLALHPGEISDVIQVEHAYTIVRLQEHAPAGKTKFENVKVQLEKELQQSKRNGLRAALDHKLRQNAKIEEM
jgi:parvulin-like peptidyl-prolyl isomerase